MEYTHQKKDAWQIAREKTKPFGVWFNIVGEPVACRMAGGRRGCRVPPRVLPGDGNGGALPVVRIDIDGVCWALALTDELDVWVGGVEGFIGTMEK